MQKLYLTGKQGSGDLYCKVLTLAFGLWHKCNAVFNILSAN